MDKLDCYVAVEFVDDPNVVGYCYWYICDFGGVKIGDVVSAPLGRHNNVQKGVVRHIKFADEEHAPFPAQFIKRIRSVEGGKV